MKDWEKQNIENAEHYGYEPQSNMLIEEMAELTQAISKYRRDNSKKNFDNIIEEIADVEVILHQIKHLLGINPKYVEQIKIEKVNRTKERIAREMRFNDVSGRTGKITRYELRTKGSKRKGHRRTRART